MEVHRNPYLSSCLSLIGCRWPSHCHHHPAPVCLLRWERRIDGTLPAPLWRIFLVFSQQQDFFTAFYPLVTIQLAPQFHRNYSLFWPNINIKSRKPSLIFNARGPWAQPLWIKFDTWRVVIGRLDMERSAKTTCMALGADWNKRRFWLG